MTKKYLLAVSGGPDSMFMLSTYRNKSIAVAHVNYHKRETSDQDEAIVRAFCEARNIPFHALNVRESATKNFQAWARETRYEFFKKIYADYHCAALLTAHHKDDFLETALMQMDSGRTPRQFGMKNRQELMGMNVERPMLFRYWKNDILKMVAKEKIPYAVDYTNDMPIYTRNAVRIELSKLSLAEKKSRYEWFMMSNKILRKKFRRVDRKLAAWKKQGYALSYFKKLRFDEKEVVYEYITSAFPKVNITSGKIQGIIDFINGRDGVAQYKISDSHSLRKENGRLIAT